MIIDSHVHVWEKSEDAYTKGDGSLETLLAQFDEEPALSKAVLLPIAPFVSNRFIARACAEHPDKLIGFASVDPHAKDAVQIFENDVRTLDLKGLKLHPRLQKITPSDDAVVALAAKAAELHVPVLIDCFPQATLSFPVENTFPEKIGELAQKVPNVNIILAHVGGYKLWDAFATARAYPNIYFDFSFSPYFFKGSSIARDLAFVLKKIGARRCIYGSDYPEVSMNESLALGKELAEAAELSSEDREYFFGNTLLSILPR